MTAIKRSGDDRAHATAGSNKHSGVAWSSSCILPNQQRFSVKIGKWKNAEHYRFTIYIDELIRPRFSDIAQHERQSVVQSDDSARHADTPLRTYSESWKISICAQEHLSAPCFCGDDCEHQPKEFVVHNARNVLILKRYGCFVYLVRGRLYHTDQATWTYFLSLNVHKHVVSQILLFLFCGLGFCSCL